MDNRLSENQKMSPIAAGITGLILGIVGTAAVALADKQTRTKVSKKANEMKDNLEKWSKDTMQDLQTTNEDIKKKTAQKTDELITKEEL